MDRLSEPNWSVLAALFVILRRWPFGKASKSQKGTEVSIEKCSAGNISESNCQRKNISWKEVKISSDVSGQVVELYGKNSVKTGQILARVNPDVTQSVWAKVLVNTAILRASSKPQELLNRDQTGRPPTRPKKTLKGQNRCTRMEQKSRAETGQCRDTGAEICGQPALQRQIWNRRPQRASTTRSAMPRCPKHKHVILKNHHQGTCQWRNCKLNIERGERAVGAMIQMTGTEIMRNSHPAMIVSAEWKRYRPSASEIPPSLK